MTRLAVLVITAYQWVLSPLLPRACRFVPTCSEYAKHAVREHGVPRGAWLAARRLLRCHPWHAGGYEPPPVRRRA